MTSVLLLLVATDTDDWVSCGAPYCPRTAIKPDETDVIVGFEERVTVGFDERTTDRGGLKDETCTANVGIVEVITLDGPITATVTGAEVDPFDIGEPTMINWLIVATVPVPLDGMPEVTPTEVRSAIC